MANEIDKNGQITFESIRRINQNGQDFWSARELGKILGYSEYRNFMPVIEKAKEACKKSGHNVLDHFVEYHEMIDIGKSAKREVPSRALSRYACYLIVQNADPSKEIVALGQTWIAGPGAGKIRVIVEKYVHLIRKTGKKPEIIHKSRWKIRIADFYVLTIIIAFCNGQRT